MTTTLAQSSASGEDYISRLPDDIVTKILSYVPTVDAVATTLLSKRWNRVWTLVPNIDIVFNSDTRLALDLEDFVSRVLTSNNVLHLRSIRLHYTRYPARERADAWMTSIANRDAEVIDIKISNALPLMSGQLPDGFWVGKNLVELILSEWKTCKLPQRVCFPKLKTITLRSFSFDDEDSFRNLFLGCPVLSKLQIQFSRVHTHTYNICSPTLRVLHLAMIVQQTQTNYYYNFVIDAPNLTDLVLVDYSPLGSHNITNVSSLAKLRLALEGNKGVLKLLTHSPGFHNLMDLRLFVNTKEQYECFPRLLHSTPNLVTLTVVLSDFHAPSCVCYDSTEEERVARCLLSCIESVTISFRYKKPRREEAIMIISYILKNAGVLKKLSILPSYSPAEGYNYEGAQGNDGIKTVLTTLPRSSKSCQVYHRNVAVV